MDEFNAYCPIRITHQGNDTVFGEITQFVATGGDVAFDMHMSNRVVVRLQPCASDYATRVQYALSLGGHRTVHPNIPVITIEGRCIRMRTFFGHHPFTRSNMVQCGMAMPALADALQPHAATAPTVIPTVAQVADIALSAHVTPPTAPPAQVDAVACPSAVDSDSDEDELLAALAEFKETILANAADCMRTREERISQLTAERDRLMTWVIPDALSVLTSVILRPSAPPVFACSWTAARGILLPALEQYARQCTGLPSLVLKAAYVYSDMYREQTYIDACSGLNGSVTHLPRTWSCGDGQYLMWRPDGDELAIATWVSDVLYIDAGVDIPVLPVRRGITVSAKPPVGAKSAIVVRVALGRCAHSPSNATPSHQSAKCGETTYMVFCAARVIPAFRVVFF